MDVVNHADTPFTPDTVDTWVVIGGQDPTHLTTMRYSDVAAGGLFNISPPGMSVIIDGLFDANDVGRWIRRDDLSPWSGEYAEITSVSTNGKTAFLSVSLGVGASDWSLWDLDKGVDQVGYIDWPVQVRVIP